jgi:type I restriction enzyme S subunit
MSSNKPLPHGWATIALSQLRLGESATLDPAKYKDEQFDLYSIPAHDRGTFEHYAGRDIGSAKKLLTPGTVLLSKLNPHISRVAVVGAHRGYRQLGSSEWVTFPRLQGLSPEYLAHFLRQDSVTGYLASNVSGVGGSLMRVNSAKVGRIVVALAPEQEQSRITDALDSHLSRLDAAIASLESAQRKLKAYRASVLKAAVEGRLVPTEAELARKEGRSYEPADVLLERILKERRRRWEEDELTKMKAAGKTPKDDRWKAKYSEPERPDIDHMPQLPEGWCWATIDQLAATVFYGSSAKAGQDNDGVPVLRMGNIVDGSLDLAGLKYLPLGHDEFPNLLLEPGDVLFNRTNSPELVGKSAIYRGTPSPCSFASYLICVRLLAGVEPQWVARVINSPFGRQWVWRVVTQQVGQANVNGSKLKAFAIPLPPFEEQRRCVDTTDVLFSTGDASQATVHREIRRISRLHQSIVSLAFQGRLVDQDLADEPAEVLLARISSERGAATLLQPKAKRSRKPKAAS